MINAVIEGKEDLNGMEKTMLDSFEKFRDLELTNLKPT